MVTVVGVARDVRGFRLTDVKEAGVFLPTGLDVAQTSIVARVQGDPNLARQALLDHLTRIDPNMGMIITMRTVARTRDVLPGDRVLGVAHSRRARIVADRIGVVQRAVVSGRAANPGDRRTNGARRLGAHGYAIDARADDAAGDGRPDCRCAALAAALATAVLATPAGALISQIVHVTDPVAYLASLGLIVAACLLGRMDSRRARCEARSDAHVATGIGRFRLSAGQPFTTDRRGPWRALAQDARGVRLVVVCWCADIASGNTFGL